MTQRILLVEDDLYAIDFVRSALGNDELDISVAHTGNEALNAVAAQRPDLIILDVGLPDLAGTQVARRLRASGINTPILMLTGMDHESHVVTGLESGATAYLTKPARAAELRAWAKALLREGALRERKRTFGDLELDAELRRVRSRSTNKTVTLTSRQVRMLAALLDAAGQPVSRQELLRRVWDMDFEPGTPIVEVHISGLRRKLAVFGDAVELATIRNVGYQLTAKAA